MVKDLRQRMGISQAQETVIVNDTEGDALDAVLAPQLAIEAFRVGRGVPSANATDVALEGWIVP